MSPIFVAVQATIKEKEALKAEKKVAKTIKAKVEKKVAEKKAAKKSK